ncbi:MAG: glycosyltransferase [Candidatus Brocadia sp. AMX2]|uniref:Glycosyltransferase n=1 Tax=Candidatus Brocadia sinica JPN1 TaxID=1197129 RepID=A0ABQ0JSP3_9BACT|nr:MULTISPECIES: TIGR04282 family arsenosugar biosynthesis glycosyltransferase [Brocadia]MBC6933666.1 glycosyltransferase [Candidatus Brocadia sp.]MBL1170498.1 glycosyltransferase [Candidatus Brocadia sp. AMX1]MCK6469899.1 TIGR04282 family arsenosugar biosynthesis glycosyltransferase [Candidatus Brocadia sinica]NOG43336.1 glycosyltransferase [Planctomycetota bacterium]KAA0243309.1 MAG: glycosyltransferase [Candidatus Brocadia sp. AMX2]
MNNVLIVFLKYPEPGKVKTRLAKALGNEKACRIYQLLAESVIRNIFLKNERKYDVHIFFTPIDKKNEIVTWLKPLIGNDTETGIHYIPQEGAELGERMSDAFQQALQKKSYERSIIIGTDCPGIDAALIEDAFEVLKKKDIVIGPCMDGGYYLLGMSGLFPDLFSGIDWSTDCVFDQTMRKIQRNHLSYMILKTLADIDTQEDLSHHAPHILIL